MSPTGELEGSISLQRGVLTLADPYDPLRPNGRRIEIHKGPNYTDKTNTTLIVESIPSGKQSPRTRHAVFYTCAPPTCARSYGFR